MIQLRDITDNDRVEIEHWPSYPADFQDLDYALREGGWLDEYRERPETWCFAAEEAGELIGFTILSKTGTDDAEFRIALRPDKTGGGLGTFVTGMTLEAGFTDIGLARIHLIVRKNNPRALRVYNGLGFKETGECVKIINGMNVDIIMMDLHKDSFLI